MLKTDILIVGTGIAGLSLAIKLATKRKDLRITIMTKENAETTNTQFAQGGVAAVMDRLKDSFDKHITDTLISGGGACDAEIVEMVVRQAPDRIQELIELGMEFDRLNSDWDLALEGGHSHSRILHHKDNTGFEIERALLCAARKLNNIKILENYFIIDLVTERPLSGDTCVGAFFFDNKNTTHYIRSKITVLSTGGCGQIFKNTTNASIATGDGVAAAARAGAEIRDMQYIQFHPTALYEPEKNPCFLLSEALRGFGAHIINEAGTRFLFAYDVRGELATRDLISKAIWEELAKSGKKHCYLDCRHLDPLVFIDKFASIHNYLKTKGIDPAHDLIPIMPVAHYQCGGISVDKNSRTTIAGLYAVGECARTGLHGKNRLASNSLLEAVVFAHQASEDILSNIDSISFTSRVFVNKFNAPPIIQKNEKIDEIRQNLKSVLEQFFIDSATEKAIYDLRNLEEFASEMFAKSTISRPMIELVNMLTVAMMVVAHSTKEKILTV